MTEKYNCPACGAPLEFSETDTTVKCGFCSAEFRIDRQDDQVNFHVSSQPEPQRRVLNQAAENLEQEAAEDLAAAMMGTARRAEGEPAAPHFATAVAEDSQPGALVFDSPNPEPSQQADTVPESTAHYQVENPAYTPSGAQTGENRNRWILIAVSVLVVTCLACACVAGALFVSQGTGIGF